METWFKGMILMILLSTSFCLGGVTYQFVTEPENLKEAYDKGYQQALSDIESNTFRKAHAFIKSRWFDEFIIHPTLADFTNTAFEIYGIKWQNYVVMLWDISFEEATLFFIDKNNTLHVYFLD